MAASKGKTEVISDDDEKGTAKANGDANTGVDTDTLVESTGADKAFVTSHALLRAASLLPVDEKATEKASTSGGKGIPKDESVVNAAVRGTGDNRFLVVVTDAGRKYVKAI